MARICKEAEHDVVEFSVSKEMRDMLRRMSSQRMVETLQGATVMKNVLTEEQKIVRLRYVPFC